MKMAEWKGVVSEVRELGSLHSCGRGKCLQGVSPGSLCFQAHLSQRWFWLKWLWSSQCAAFVVELCRRRGSEQWAIVISGIGTNTGDLFCTKSQPRAYTWEAYKPFSRALSTGDGIIDSSVRWGMCPSAEDWVVVRVLGWHPVLGNRGTC